MNSFIENKTIINKYNIENTKKLKKNFVGINED